MSYYAQSRLASDQQFMMRVTACVATEGVADPQGWVFERQWKLSAQPGWATAYKYALDSGVDDPGADESVITDAQILSAVQSLLAEE